MNQSDARKNTILDSLFEKDAFAYMIPARMQNYRANANITQKTMAEKLGVSKTYISNIERGKTKLPADILLGYI